MSKVLVIYQSFGGSTKSLAEAAAKGAASSGAETEVKEVTSVSPDDLSNIDGLILATTQPFESMAGDTKSLFERLWMGKDKVKKGTPLSVILCYKTDPKATEASIKVIADYLGLKKLGDWLEVKADEVKQGKERARQLGVDMTLGV
jgi:flavodoxin